MHEQLSDTSPEPLKAMLKRFCIVLIFSVAFAYIEAAVVVYLRAIFYPQGFTFPLTGFGISPLWQRILLTEIVNGFKITHRQNNLSITCCFIGANLTDP